MGTNDSNELCREVEEAMAEILDGTADPRLFDHVAECDACRDAKHEASLAAAWVRDAGADFRAPDRFAESLLLAIDRRIEERGGGAPAPAATVAAAPLAPPAPVETPRASGSGTLVMGSLSTPQTVVPETHPTVPVPMTATASAVTGAEAPIAAWGPPGHDMPPIAGAAPVPAPPPRAPTPPARRAFLRRASTMIGAAGALAAAASVALYLKGRTPAVSRSDDGPWSGTIASIARASSDASGGVEVCDRTGACSTAANGAVVKPGSTIRTDARTRAHLTLGDGTDLALDRATEIQLSTDASRAARLKAGTIVAEVAHIDDRTASFAFARGSAEVLGTRLSITSTEQRASVEVARGAVRVKNEAGRAVEVHAGEEASLEGQGEPIVTSSMSLADKMEWSEERTAEDGVPALRGLGELRARKPGQTKEKESAVRLAKHAVKVRVVDIVARTEVDETFTNDTDEELEGIYRFPLPPGAQIEKLSLEVDGKLVDGAFVDRDRGAAIWRGVIQNAAPKTPRPREEIVWVPGPWRDPALLEWQRGGRFELKIFPIPKRGSRRVILTYTEKVEPSGGVRRFTYPLAHEPSGTKIGSFDLDVSVLGLDESVGLATRGYDLTASANGGSSNAPTLGLRRTFHADNFVPAGDLTVEYALPDRDKEVTAWAYAAPSSPAWSVTGPMTGPRRATTEGPPDDPSPYVAITVRPHLPRWQEAKDHVHVIVVDTSRSMFGERFARARRLASSMVREMDRRDTFMVLACDTVCRSMNGTPQGPGAAASDGVDRFLSAIEPEGGSDLAASVAAARAAVGTHPGKELRIVYLGDGTPTVGPTRASHIETAVRAFLPEGNAGVVAVAVGADADTTSLAAMARGGGGVMVPYVPGQHITTAAVDILAAANGVLLRDPEVELPPGLSQVTPARLDSIRAGGETLLVARMSGDHVEGPLKLSGRVGGERFEQSYPLSVRASSAAGNAFVPRLFAAARIAELERTGGETQKPMVIELSKRFSVASRYTSLLVLESEAMFRAFGLDRNTSAPTFTGEEAADSVSTKAAGKSEEKGLEPSALAPDEEAPEARLSAGGGHAARAASPAATAAPPADVAADKDDGATRGPRHGRPGGYASPATPPPPAAPAKKAARLDDEPSNPFVGDMPMRRRFVPMRRVYERHVGFEATNPLAAANAAKITAAESAFALAPDSRDRTVELFALYASAGRVGEAETLVDKWSGRDALDPDALRARADLAARQGDRERAVRMLEGVADLRPSDRTVQARLADLWEAAGNAALACEHRIALADLVPGEAKLVAAAVSCARSQGMNDLAAALRIDTTETVRQGVDRALALPPPSTGTPRGDVQISATWSGGMDLDLALIDAEGKRTSWLGSGGKATVTARDATSTQAESLDIVGLPQGTYVLEVSRAAGAHSTDPAHGEVVLRLNGEIRRVPFALVGARAELGAVRVSFTSHLEPL